MGRDTVGVKERREKEKNQRSKTILKAADTDKPGIENMFKMIIKTLEARETAA